MVPDALHSKSFTPTQEGAKMQHVSPCHAHHQVTPTRSAPIFRTRSLSDSQHTDIVVNPGKELRKSPNKSSWSTDNLSHSSTAVKHTPARRTFSARGRIQHYTRERVYTAPSLGGRLQLTRKQSTNASEERFCGTSGRGSNEFDEDRTSGSISFTMTPIILKYDGEELEYQSQRHNFSIRIPKGALKKKGTVEIQIGLAIHGPFTFPEQCCNVSPILWLCSIPDTKFRKPIQITLPHCVTDARLPASFRRRRLEGCDGIALQFTAASLKSGSSSSSNKARVKQQFEFHPTEGEELITAEPSSMSGVLSTKHLSPLCIVASCGKSHDLPREVALHAIYCIVPVIPATISGREWNVHFCITFNLNTCIQV